MTFFSGLRLFPERGIGIFVSRDGNGEIMSSAQLGAIPNPTALIANRFLPKAPEAAGPQAAAFPSNAEIAGVYQSSRREQSSFLRLADLILFQRVIKVDSDGNTRSFSTLWPFGAGRTGKRIGPNLYEGASGARVAFVDGNGAEPYFASPGAQLQRAPWYLDLRWIAPALVASTAVVLLTLLTWPVTALGWTSSTPATIPPLDGRSA